MNQTISILISLLLGYYLGLQRYNKDIKEVKKRIGKAKAIITGTKSRVLQGKSGAIQRPSAERLKKIKAGEQVEAKAWDETPELRKLKQ